jgi:hypothetical protein
MNLFDKNIANLSEDDIKRLISNGVSESKTLDYKRELKIDTGDDKKEFLYDITSLANTEGGALVFGIEEQKDVKKQNTGIPSKIIGVKIDNKDKLIQKIEDLVKNNVEPSINSLTIKFLEVDGLDILIIGIPKSIGLPYMVTYNSTNKFYKRRNSGKYLLDVYELSNAFMSSLKVKELANNFRRIRVKEVRELKFLPKLDIEGSYFLHIIPLGHIGENIIDISSETKLNYLKENLQPIGSNGYDFRHNLEGFMTFTNDPIKKNPFSYVQLFRDGILEFYTSHLHFRRQNEPEKLDIFGGFFERISLQCIEKAFGLLRFYQIEPPYAVFISLFDLEDAVIFVQNPGGWGNKTQVIGKSQLLFPAVVFNDTQQDISKVMKSTFDILWQAGNYTKSPFYNDNSDRIAIQ